MHKGDVVTTNECTQGVITDYDCYGPSVLVRLTDGPSLSELDVSHGRWYSLDEITGTVGHMGNALVWSGARMVPAGQLTHPLEF